MGGMDQTNAFWRSDKYSYPLSHLSRHQKSVFIFVFIIWCLIVSLTLNLIRTLGSKQSKQDFISCFDAEVIISQIVS